MFKNPSGMFAALLVVVFAFALVVPVSSVMPPVTKTFCISGSSTGAGWSYNLNGFGMDNITVNTDGVPAGSSATALARHWVNSINIAPGNTSYRARFSHTDADGNAYFTITARFNFEFSVGNCVITGNPDGCSFNPTVIEV